MHNAEPGSDVRYIEDTAMNTRGTIMRAPRILAVFAHPDDETFCAGGTLAMYAEQGAELMVISATRGDAGQIHDSSAATRGTLGLIREQELRRARSEERRVGKECRSRWSPY